MSHVIHVKVRRDAHTTTPVTVRPHEIAVLKHIFGDENIHTHGGRVIDVKNLAADDVAGFVPLSEDEFGRLAAKYGGNEKGFFVEQVYGTKASGGLDAAMERLDAQVAELVSDDPAGEAKPRGRRSAKADDPAGEGGQE